MGVRTIGFCLTIVFTVTTTAGVVCTVKGEPKAKGDDLVAFFLLDPLESIALSSNENREVEN